MYNSGAVIIAAGLSSRMGCFKPLLKFGTSTIIETIIQTLQDAHVNEIVIITGHCAEHLEKYLAEYPVKCIRNPYYKTSEMFDSALLGFQELYGKCRKVLFSPADIPAYQLQTVQILLDTDVPLACPTYQMKKGHPLMMSSYILKQLLNDSGTGGIKGALSRTGIPMTYIPVDDPGILFDADTYDEYQTIRNLFQA